MATITVELKKKVGHSNVAFLVRSGQTRRRIGTGLKLMPADLSANGKKIKNLVKARLIELKRRELQDKLDEIMVENLGRVPNADYLVTRLMNVESGLDFFRFADEWLAHTQIKSKTNYVCMLRDLEKRLGRRVLSFRDISYNMLEDYEVSLRNRPRARTMYLGAIRHLYREAMRRYNTDYDTLIKTDPFLRFRVPRQVLKRGVRALTLAQLLSIYNYQGEGTAQLARDCFILSFCLMGMNAVDMYLVRDGRGGVLRYNRAKTKDRRADGAYIEVRVHPFIAPLTKKYAGKERVFNFAERYAKPYNFNHALNLGLKQVGSAVGIDGLQFYQARHTFATLSRNLMRFAKSDVDEALNHVGALDLADVYIARDFSIINDNNAKLIERVFGGGMLKATI